MPADFKLMESKLIEENKDFDFSDIFYKYDRFKSKQGMFKNIITQLNGLYKNNFWIDINHANSTKENDSDDQLVFITNFRYNDINFLIGIHSNNKTCIAGIICTVALYTSEQLLYPYSEKIRYLCDNTMIMNNTSLYWRDAPGNNIEGFFGTKFKYELVVPNDKNFGFIFNTLDTIIYNCNKENFDPTSKYFSREETIRALELNINIINQKLGSNHLYRMGDFLIGINDYNPNEIINDSELPPDKFSFYINNDDLYNKK